MITNITMNTVVASGPTFNVECKPGVSYPVLKIEAIWWNFWHTHLLTHGIFLLLIPLSRMPLQTTRNLRILVHLLYVKALSHLCHGCLCHFLNDPIIAELSVQNFLVF